MTSETSSLLPGLPQLKAGLKAWCKEISFFSKERSERNEASRRILEAFQKKLPELVLPKLGLTSLPECINMLTHLTMLYACDSHLTELPDFTGLSQLRLLFLSDNKLREVHESIGKLPSLQTFHVDGNKELKSLPEGFSQLQVLKITRTAIRNFPRLPANCQILKDPYSLESWLQQHQEGEPVALFKGIEKEGL